MYLPQLERCGLDALNIYKNLVNLSSKNLLSDFIANLLANYPKINHHIMAMIGSFVKYPQLINEELLSFLCDIIVSGDMISAENIANQFILAMDSGVTLNVELIKSITSKNPEITFDDLIILNQHANLLLQKPELLTHLLTYPLITNTLILQTNAATNITPVLMREDIQKTLKYLTDNLHDANLDEPFECLPLAYSYIPLLAPFYEERNRRRTIVDKIIKQLYRHLSDDKSIAGEYGEKLSDYIKNHKNDLTRDSFIVIFYLLDLANLPVSKKV